jgi:hypothetical protein
MARIVTMRNREMNLEVLLLTFLSWVHIVENWSIRNDPEKIERGYARKNNILPGMKIYHPGNFMKNKPSGPLT